MGILTSLTIGTKTPLRVAAYCRVSTEEELQTESYESQRAFFTREIEEHPHWNLTAVYGDRMTGTSTESRLGFQRMMKHAEAGTIDYILTKSISRFSRSTADTILALRKLRSMNIGVYFMEQGIDSLSDMGNLILETLAAVAEMESSSISQNLKLTLDAMNERGNPVRKTAYGYEKDKESRGNNWIIKEQDALRVKLAFLMASEGYTFTEIAERLNQFEEKDRTGKKWERNIVRRLLTNEAYVGDILTNKRVMIWNGTKKESIENDGREDQFYIKNHHDPIVGRELFERIQELNESQELAGQRNFRVGVLQELRVLARRDKLLDSVRRYPPYKKGRCVK